MPKKSSVAGLPTSMKSWLDEALVANNFSRYRELEAELKKRGYELSKSALQRYGSRFEAQLGKIKEAAEKARAVVAASPDDDDDMSQALMRLTQAKLMEVMEAIEFDPDKTDLSKLTLHVSRLVRASLPLKQFKAKAKAELARRIDALESEVAAAAVPGQPASAEDVMQAKLALLKRVRENAYAIYDD